MPKVLLIKPLSIQFHYTINTRFNRANPVGTVLETTISLSKNIDSVVSVISSDGREVIIIDREQHCFKILKEQEYA